MAGKKEVGAKEETVKQPTEEQKCVWHLGSNCSGAVTLNKMFTGQLNVPICENHIEGHKYIMILHKNKYDVEQILNETEEWRKQEVLTLALSGVNIGEVDL